MGKNININSPEWCDILFKNRNKAYGAYKMRQASFKDHIIAFGITVLFTVAISLLSLYPNSNSKIGFEYERTGGGCGGFGEATTIEIIQLPAPPKMQPPMHMFYEPEITPDDKVIQVTGDNKNGILYEDGQCMPLELEFITMSPTEIIHGDPYFPDHPYCPNIPVIIEDPDTGTGCGHPVEFLPTYPGGEKELYKFLKKLLRYPARASEEGIQGRVLIGFTVDRTGAITNIKIIRSLDLYCDEEAIRLVKKMPKWIPGKANGRTISVNYILPIQFSLI